MTCNELTSGPTFDGIAIRLIYVQPMKTIGHWIRHHRRARRLSQKGLSDLLGVSQSTISTWEGGVYDVSRAHFVDIARALRVPISAWPDAMQLPQVAIQQAMAS